MFPARTRSFALAALIVIGTSGTAQSQSGKVFARYNKPLRSVSLDLDTGTITRGPIVNDRVGTTTIDFDNNDLGGFVGVDTGNGFCEWFDAGVKGFAGNGSDLMNNFVFAYCSAMLTPGSGGPGGTLKMGFYEGYQLFGGTPTTAVAVFTLSGLPGNSASSSFFGGFACYFINVSFGGALVGFADGPIGYSWGFLDVGTDGTLAGTWPFLSCVVSCSGAIGQVDGQGMTDAIDEYCPPGTLRSTFTFGTTSGSFTSMSMDIREATDTQCGNTLYNCPATPNPDILSIIFAPTFIGTSVGQTQNWRLVRGAPSPPGNWSVTVRPNRIPLPCGVQGPAPLPIGAGGRILISGPLLTAFGGTHNGIMGTIPTAVPASLNLINVHFAAQATVLGGGVKVSSAVEGTVGTF
jgi:hypothetical protein